MFSKENLKTAFRQAGLGNGDLVLVHSALRALGPVEGGADTVLDALLEILGPDGTLALPTHTFRVVTAAQPVFHQLLTPSNVGALSNVFRVRPGVVRGLHPTHSVAAIGPLAEKLLEGHEKALTPCSADSPYWRLREWGGKILIIGAGLNCCTLFHACEEFAGMKQVHDLQELRLFSITADNSIIPVSTRRHVLHTWDQYPLLEPDLISIGALSVTHLGTCALRLLDARAAADWLVPRLRRDPSLILPDLTKQSL
jgi:aminoglycoside 3-N-acetyltransferase